MTVLKRSARQGEGDEGKGRGRKSKMKREGKRRGEIVLDEIKVGADLKPLSRVTKDMVGREQNGEEGGKPGAVLQQPVALENARHRHGVRVQLLLREDGDFG